MEKKAMLVYYLHFQDERFIKNNWNVCRDYAACVMASTQQEAIEKVTAIASKQPGYHHIKIMGFGYANAEWVNEEAPLKSNEDFYKQSVKKVFERVKQRRNL